MLEDLDCTDIPNPSSLFGDTSFGSTIDGALSNAPGKERKGRSVVISSKSHRKVLQSPSSALISIKSSFHKGLTPSPASFATSSASCAARTEDEAFFPPSCSPLPLDRLTEGEADDAGAPGIELARPLRAGAGVDRSMVLEIVVCMSAGAS